MNTFRNATRLLATLALAATANQAALATDYSGTLAFDANPATEVTFAGPFGPITGDVGVDLHRFDLGSALDGSVGVTFTTHGAYDENATMLALVFATNPNDAIVSNPTSLAAFVSPTTDVTAFLNANVAGWTYAAWGNAIASNGTTDVSAIFSPPMSFTAGTHYYAFVAGGSAYQNGSLTDATVGYTLSVAAVPEPESWAMLIAGLGLVGLFARRRAA